MTAHKNSTTMDSKQTLSSRVEHRFGGDWTEQKLDILERYLSAYLQALSKRRIYKIYIDAFAGTGYRTYEEKGNRQGSLFPSRDQEDEPGVEALEASARHFLEGSAVRALKLDPGFDSYHFIELSSRRAAQLEMLKARFPKRKIFVHQGDANEKLQALLNRIPWQAHLHSRNQKPRAVLFLDPYGMKVDWETLRIIAGTRAIDLWYLFPSGIGANRLMTCDGRIPPKWRERLDRCFGTQAWFERFYRMEEVTTLFGQEKELTKTADIDEIEKFLVERLKNLFSEVAPQPRRLCNSKGQPMYSFCFAASNPAGARIALRIARHILEHM